MISLWFSLIFNKTNKYTFLTPRDCISWKGSWLILNQLLSSGQSSQQTIINYPLTRKTNCPINVTTTRKNLEAGPRWPPTANTDWSEVEKKRRVFFVSVTDRAADLRPAATTNQPPGFGRISTFSLCTLFTIFYRFWTIFLFSWWSHIYG